VASTRLDATALGLLVALAFVWAPAFILIRAGLLAGASPFLFAGIRFALAAGIGALVALARREPWPRGRQLGREIVVGAFALMGGYALLLYWGEQSTPGGYASVMIATAPILSAAFAYWLLPGERFAPRGALALGLGFAGVTLLFVPDLAGPGASPAGAAAELGAALVFSVGSVLLRRWSTPAPGLWVISLQFAASAALFLPIVAFDAGSERFPLTIVPVVTVVYLAAVSSVLGFVLYFALHQRVGPARANLVSYVNPTVGLLTGLLLLGEVPGPLELAGLALIVAGIAFVQREGSARTAVQGARPPGAGPIPSAGPAPGRERGSPAGGTDATVR